MKLFNKVRESLRRASFMKVWRFKGRSFYFSFLTGYSKSEKLLGFTFELTKNTFKNGESKWFKFAFYLIFFDIMFSYSGKWREEK